MYASSLILSLPAPKPRPACPVRGKREAPRSIEADNTSAFNCRYVDGTTRWSEHAYGRAIDLNPIENPYVTGAGTTSHAASRSYLRRSPYRPGMAVEGGLVVRAFEAAGWSWGGRWSGDRDYQHFSASGR